MTIRTRLTVWFALALLVALGRLGRVVLLRVNRRTRQPDGQARHPSNATRATAVRQVAETGLFFLGVPALVVALGGGWWMMRQAWAPWRPP